MKRDLASLWIGGPLGGIEIASIHSFLRHGHRLTIYGYEPIPNLPPRVAFRDAAGILPTRRIVRHRRSGSPAPHSDLFRYALMARTEDIWVDLDIIAVKPLVFDSPFVFGFEDRKGSVNNAVLRLPASSETLRALLAFTEDTVAVPPLLTGFRRWKYWLRGMGRGLPIDAWPWGSIGPHALTHHLNRTGEIAHALPVEAFYAVPLGQMARFVTPGGFADRDIPPEAVCLHLWGGLMRTHLNRHHGGTVPEGSFLAARIADARRDGLAA